MDMECGDGGVLVNISGGLRRAAQVVVGYKVTSLFPSERLKSEVLKLLGRRLKRELESLETESPSTLITDSDNGGG